MKKSGEGDLLSQAYSLLTTFFGDGRGAAARSGETGRGPAGQAEAHVDARPLLSGPDSSQDARAGEIEQAAHGVIEFLQRQTAATGLFRYHSRPGRDQVVVPGEPVELSVELDPLLGVAARQARFRIGEHRLEEVGFGPDRTARLLYTPREQGLFTVCYEILDSGGNLLDGAPGQETILQVVDGAPVAAVAADLVLERGSDELRPLLELTRRGWQLVYLDMTVRDRSRDIRRALARKGLPAGAALVHPAKDVEFKTLSVDFSEVFGLLTLRRVRATGVPLVLLVGRVPWMVRLVERGEISGTGLSQLRDLLGQEQGLERWERVARRFAARRSTEDPFSWRLDRMTRARSTDSNTCLVEFDNARARERILEAIDLAQKSVHLQFYLFKDCRFAQQLAVRLVARARAGVRVRLLVDGVVSAQETLGRRNELLEGLSAEPDIDVVAVDPIRTASEIEALRLKQRDHRKLIIMDGCRAFVSGRNAGDEYYTGFTEVPIADWTPAESIPWLDAHIEVLGPLVPEIQRSFIESWERSRGEDVPEAEAFPGGPDAAGSSRARLVVHQGVQDANALAAYEAIIDAARSHLFVINDFPVVASLAAALRRAVARKVDVHYITGNANARRVDGSTFQGSLHRELFEYATKQRFEQLIHWGVRVYEYSTPRLPNIVSRGGMVRPYVHAKVLTADGRVASVGSANLDATAGYWEREANIIVEDPALVGRVERDIRRMLERSYEIDLESEYWKREAAQRAMLGSLWPEGLI